MFVELQGGSRDPGDLLLRLPPATQDEGRVHVLVSELSRLAACLGRLRGYSGVGCPKNKAGWVGLVDGVDVV